MLGFIRLVLGPVLLAQGRQVRKSILRLPEADGPREGNAGQGDAMSVLILGDSSAAGVGAQDQSQALSGQLAQRLAARCQVTWYILAQTGWTTADGLEALKGLGDRQFDVAVVSLGVNDVTTETGVGRWLQLYGELLDRMRDANGVKTMIASGLPPFGRFPALPQPLRWYLGQQGLAYDHALREMARDKPGVRHLGLDFGDLDEGAMAEDGFHPGPDVYAAWASQIASALEDSELEAMH